MNIKKSSVCNYIKKQFKIDKEKITHICIDDVAIWLSEYPNLQVVVRDGSINFKAVIDASHPNVIQVNDRFHMIKNLVKALKKVL